MKRNLHVLLFFAVILTACNSGKGRLDIDVSESATGKVNIHRYDLALFRLDPSADLQGPLEALQPEFRFFLDADLGDTGKIGAMRDYLLNARNREFYEVAKKKYHDLKSIENDLELAFRHVVHYYPGFRIPRVYAYISGGDYEFPVQFADSVLLIGLDCYLGRDYGPYVTDGLPLYRIGRMNPDHIVPDCMRTIISALNPAQMPGNNLLDQMIAAGKRLYLLDAMIPSSPDDLKIGYTKEQMEWIGKNEKNIWTAIITNQMLYSTDGNMIRGFMADGPFTAEFSKDSPPRMGEYLGWKIVSKYMENHPATTLPGLMKSDDSQFILSESGYKP